MYRIRRLERNYPNPAVILQCSMTALTKTMLIIICRMFSGCNDSEDCHRTLSETFSCARQLTRLVVLVLSRGHCDCYTHSVFILTLIFAEHLILTHRTQFKNHCLIVMQEASDALSKLQTVTLFQPIRSLQCSWWPTRS